MEAKDSNQPSKQGQGSRGNKRQHSRIQGGWAALSHSDGRNKRQGGPSGVESHRVANRDISGHSGSSSHSKTRQEDTSYRPQSSSQPTINPIIYTFQSPEQPVNVQPAKERTIDKTGVHMISGSEDYRPSRIELIYNFVEPDEAEQLFHLLDNEIAWKQQMNTNRSGEKYPEPRKVAWYGDFSYSYSRVSMEPIKEWPPTLLKMKHLIEKKTKLTFNSVLSNKYRDGRDGVGWHSDNEYGLGDQPNIASLSFGETRMFKMRKNPSKDYDPMDYSMSEKLSIPLKSGSLLLMTGYVQDDWQHQVPKEYHDKNMRINLTFRTIYDTTK